nr:LCP family protein [Actinomyces bowdenii]
MPPAVPPARAPRSSAGASGQSGPAQPPRSIPPSARRAGSAVGPGGTRGAGGPQGPGASGTARSAAAAGSGRAGDPPRPGGPGPHGPTVGTGASGARPRRPQPPAASRGAGREEAHSPASRPTAGSTRSGQAQPGRAAAGAAAGAASGRDEAGGNGFAGPRRPRVSSGQSRARAGSSAVPLDADAAPGTPASSGSQAPRGGAPASARRGTFPARPRAYEGTRVMPAGARASRPDPRPAVVPAGSSPDQPEAPASRDGGRRGRKVLRWVAITLVVLLVLVGARVAWLWHSVSSQLQRVEALSGAQDTPGETWLIVGSDARADGPIQDGTEGARADSVMLLHRADNGQASLTTLPRDTYAEIPDYGGEKINAAYSLGGPQLLVRTVESLSGLTVDHYVEVGMGGVSQMVDAVEGVEVCLDYDVDDPDSGLVWDTSQGTCQSVDGTKALAYARMRKADPTGDIGRGLRQRAVISAVVSKATSSSTITSLSQQDALVDAGTQVLTVDESSGVIDLAQMMLAFRAASGEQMTGAPPIEDLAYEPGGIGQSVLLEGTTAPEFFTRLREGELTPADFNQPT